MAKTKEEGNAYHPRLSNTSDDVLAEFIRAPVRGRDRSITEVPGIGPATAKQLAKGADSIENTTQLIAKFMALSLDEPNCVEHCNRFKKWLIGKKVVNTSLNNIVEAIAEKADTMVPGLYDTEHFD